MTIEFQKMGDFYEAYGDAAILVGKELGLTITRTRKGDDVMCGIPYHRIYAWSDELRANGHTVTF